MTSLIPGGGRGGAFDPFSYDIWDPFDIARSWLWDNGRPTTAGRGEDTSRARTYVDWLETDDAHIFTADLPGVRKEDMKVEVEEGNILKISGERATEEENKKGAWHRMERQGGKFVRWFRLPDNANMEEIKCSMANGVLNITVPKKPRTAPQTNVRTINIA